MVTYTVGDFKAHFSEIIERVKKGEKIAITFGRRKEVVALLVPNEEPLPDKRPLGILENKASVTFGKDFKMTEAEFLGI